MSKTADQYAIQQASLRNQGHAPADSEDDIHIDPPQDNTPSINPELLKDVEPMLFRGFLHVSAEINGVSFIFKSLNHHEFSHLNLMAGMRSDYKSTQRFYNLFLAFGVFMVDGTNVLADRENLLPVLVDEFFSKFTEEARRKVVFELSEVNRRAARAVILTEVFAQETRSRLRWAQVRGIDLSSTAITGVEGTSQLGLNWGQLGWRALNHLEDTRESSEREWENAKFVASSMAGKGMSRVHAQDKKRRKEEKEQRLERRDKILRLALLGEGADEEQPQFTMTVARTVEDLAKQLERDLKGEKDWHDQVVDAHDQLVQDQRETRMERLREIQAEYEEKYGDAPVIGRTSTDGLTKEQVAERITRRRQLAAQRIASRQVLPEMMDPKAGTFMDKWHGPVGKPKFRGLSIPKNRGES